MAESAPADIPTNLRHAAERSPRRVADIARIEATYGQPRALDVDVAMTGWEFGLLRYSKRDGRYRDATILIPMHGKLVCIVKHAYPDGIARPPSGGVVPGEPIDSAAEREAYEETGLRVRLRRYLLAVSCWFHVDPASREPSALALAEASRRDGGADAFFFDEIARYAAANPATGREYWESHVFWAEPVGGTLAPLDTREVKAVVLLTADDLEHEVHDRMRASGIGGFDYRVTLQEAALEAARAEGLLPPRHTTA